MNLTSTVRTALAARLARAIPTTPIALLALADTLRATDRAAYASLASLAYADAPGAAAFLGIRRARGIV